MPRFDLAFFLCCCKACLGSPSSEQESFYSLLSIEKDATQDEIKRAYKRQSLKMHPDKIAQRGASQEEIKGAQAKFQRMKEAYEVLSDPHKRETYDAIGEKGMKWIDEPLSIDPQELATNFANSSFVDRSKIFGIFVFFAVAILIQPLLICLQLDGKFGNNAKWGAILTPLWIWNAFILFYHSRVIMMGDIPKPDHIPSEEWQDPMPMKKRVIALVRFLLFFAFEVQLALHLDGINSYSWGWVLTPLFCLEAMALYIKVPQSRKVILTMDELQSAMGKDFSEFTEEEKASIERAYLIVPNRNGAPYDSARHMVNSAKVEVTSTLMKVAFMILVLLKLDDKLAWSWWLIFIPFFLTAVRVCLFGCNDFAEVQADVEELLQRDEMNAAGTNADATTDYGAMEEGAATNTNENTNTTPPLTEEEKEEIRARVSRSSSILAGSLCSQFFYIIFLIVIITKIQGASFSTLWIISPILIVVSILLCCLGCMIFCVAPIEDDAFIFDGQDPTSTYHNMDSVAAAAMSSMPYSAAPTQPSEPIVVPPPPVATVSTPDNTSENIASENTSKIALQPPSTDAEPIHEDIVSSVEVNVSDMHTDEVTENKNDETEKTSTEPLTSTAPVEVPDLLDAPSDEKGAFAPTTEKSEVVATIETSAIAPTASEIDDLD
ncbi:hypothetical protein CTEN210_11214 [Chaetoceros tenuissimus]|uniref:J domain-containing protein n=1 Tax=Chaetoceros tenuissimus TaxID=426638 RepID=A0AAD3H9B4_9STRA|nr:hypothetical protein CTEN210_11214 [Chaetoceros tenuissimus]